MRGAIRAWIPAAVIAVAVAGLLLVAGWFSLRQGRTAVVVSPSASVDLHSPEAVMAAVRHYYDVEAEARRTGDAELIDSVTTGHDSLASYNFRLFLQQQALQGRHSVVLENYFSDWSVSFKPPASARVRYVFSLLGHDTDLNGKAVEADMTIPAEDYEMLLDLRELRWAVRERRYLGRHAS